VGRSRRSPHLTGPPLYASTEKHPREPTKAGRNDPKRKKKAEKGGASAVFGRRSNRPLAQRGEKCPPDVRRVQGGGEKKKKKREG